MSAALLCAIPATAKETDSPSLFLQMAPVFQSPRCMNCHTADQFPHQGDDQHRHTMWVARGPDDHGAPGLHCSTCHQAKNNASSGVPGAPDWHLAPLRMAWQGLSIGELCRALSDPKHGNMAPAHLDAHFRTGLVEWAWHPGTDSQGHARTVPPVAYDRFLALTKAWVDSGTKCPA